MFLKGRGKRERPRVMTGQTGGEAWRHMAVVKKKERKKSERDVNLQKTAGGGRGRSVRE